MAIRDGDLSAARRTWLARLRTRASRRLLVVALAALCAVFVLLSILGVTGIAALGVIAMLLATDALLMLATSNVAELSEHLVDERQEAARNHAYRFAYRVVMHCICWPTAVVVVLAAFGDPTGWLRSVWSNTALVVALGTSLAQLVAFLPTMVIAWTDLEPVEAE